MCKSIGSPNSLSQYFMEWIQSIRTWQSTQALSKSSPCAGLSRQQSLCSYRTFLVLLSNQFHCAQSIALLSFINLSPSQQQAFKREHHHLCSQRPSYFAQVSWCDFSFSSSQPHTRLRQSSLLAFLESFLVTRPNDGLLPSRSSARHRAES